MPLLAANFSAWEKIHAVAKRLLSLLSPEGRPGQNTPAFGGSGNKFIPLPGFIIFAAG